MSSAFELAASIPATAAAPSTMTVALLAPVARPRPPISRLLVVPKLPRARLPRLVGSRRAAAVALHAPREIHVRTFRALPVAVSYARGRRAGPAAPVRLLCLRLRCGLLDEDRVPREVRRFSHACRPVGGGSPVGHFACFGLGSAATRGRCGGFQRLACCDWPAACSWQALALRMYAFWLLLREPRAELSSGRKILEIFVRLAKRVYSLAKRPPPGTPSARALKKSKRS